MEGFNGQTPNRREIKIVGSAPEKGKKSVENEIQERFRGEHFKGASPEKIQEVKERFHEQGPREKEYIRRINEITNKIIEECGGVPFNIPGESIFFINEKTPQYDRQHEGWHNSVNQAIFIKGDPNSNPIKKAIICLHEMIHMKAWLSVEVSEKHKAYDIRRSGISTYRAIAGKEGSVTREGKTEYVMGRGLDEAITSDIEQKHWKEIIENNPYFADQEEWMKQDFYKDEQRKAEKKWQLPEGEVTHHDEEDGWEIASYIDPRSALKYMEEEIAGALKISEKEAEKLFYQAYFTGRLLPLARAIEKAFGDGAFQKVMHMKPTEESAKETMEFLKQRQESRK